MAQVNPFTGVSQVMASTPRRWLSVTPHASNYIEGDESEHSVAIAFYSSDGGDVTYLDMYGQSVTQTLLPGTILPTSAIRVTAFTGTDLDAGFVTGPL